MFFFSEKAPRSILCPTWDHRRQQCFPARRRVVPGNSLGFIFVAARLPLSCRGKAEATQPQAGALRQSWRLVPKVALSRGLGATMPRGWG